MDHMQAGRSPPPPRSLFQIIFYTYVLNGGNAEREIPMRRRADQFHNFLLGSEQDQHVHSLEMVVIWCPTNETL
jgi:hypothetical protein